MNAVEIEEAVSNLALEPFNRVEFPFAFLSAFGNKETTIKRLRAGASNKSDLGGILQTNNLHILVVNSGEVTRSIQALKNSPATTKAKAQFIVATDGETFEAEDLTSGESIACEFQSFPDHFGFFLPLAGISTVKQIRESSFDIRATSRLNRLYIELLKDNPEWGNAERRHDLNHFIARLIFCFFAQDTGIFSGSDLFTDTIEKMSERDSSNTHLIIGELFRAMNTDTAKRSGEKIARWAEAFPYVNGGLFSGAVDAPIFSKISRSYLLHIGSLDWTKINPDIFGSMIQAVADDEERGELGMHYTSVPNILKVLNPLFLDDLRAQLEEAGDNPRALLNLRKRLSKIRVFDPACGSGNFLVIAYKQVREIENTINERRGEVGRKTDMPLTNYRGIELRDFSCEIARLALVIAEYQCDLLYLGQKEALAVFLPLDSKNWITCDNALRLDWLNFCPPTGTSVKLISDDLFNISIDQAEIDFENEGGETYICGNPPYQGSVNQTESQKEDMKALFGRYLSNYKDLDYVSCWFLKAAEYIQREENSAASLVSTNSLCQGEQVALLWPIVFSKSIEIIFAHTSFEWANLAANNAGVTCIIVGLGHRKIKRIFNGEFTKEVSSISPYLIAGDPIIVYKASKPLSDLPTMVTGNLATDGGNLLLSYAEKELLMMEHKESKKLIKRFMGANELTNGKERWCLWIEDDQLALASQIPSVAERIQKVRKVRQSSRGSQAKGGISTPHKFVFTPHKYGKSIVVPKVSTSSRQYMPCVLCDDNTVVSDLARVIYDSELWSLSIISSRIHLVWVGAVCGRFRTGYRYSQTLGWNTFPVPTLTEKNKIDLTRCAEDILLAREAAYPATIAELYEVRDGVSNMPPNLLEAHERNDETLERIYIGRRFRNDTERLEKLFELYTKMTVAKPANQKKVKA